MEAVEGTATLSPVPERQAEAAEPERRTDLPTPVGPMKTKLTAQPATLSSLARVFFISLLDANVPSKGSQRAEGDRALIALGDAAEAFLATAAPVRGLFVWRPADFTGLTLCVCESARLAAA